LRLPTAWKAFKARTAQQHSQSSSGESSDHAGFTEKDATVSINAAHFARKQDGAGTAWRILPELGISGASVVYGPPGLLANADTETEPPLKDAPWLEYEFDTHSRDEATLTLCLLPTFPIDSQHRLRYAVAIDGHAPVMLDAGGSGEWQENSAPTWSGNVLRNFAVQQLSLDHLQSGHHTLRMIYRDPGVVLEHLTITFPSAPSAYPVPPETKRQ